MHPEEINAFAPESVGMMNETCGVSAIQDFGMRCSGSQRWLESGFRGETVAPEKRIH